VKKILKRALVGLGCVLLLPILLFGFLFATREPPDGPRVDAGAGVVGVETGGAYAWIVRTQHGAVLVDAGMDASGAAILTELRAQGLSAGDVVITGTCLVPVAIGPGDRVRMDFGTLGTVQALLSA